MPNHQFVIGVSGYTAFPAIGDPTPVRLLPPPVDPKRFVRRHKRKAFASWDQKVRLMQAASATEKFGTWGAHVDGVYEKLWASTYTPNDAYTQMERITRLLHEFQHEHHIDDEIIIRCKSRRSARNLLQALMRSASMQCQKQWQCLFHNMRNVKDIHLNHVRIDLDIDAEELNWETGRRNMRVPVIYQVRREEPPVIGNQRGGL